MHSIHDKDLNLLVVLNGLLRTSSVQTVAAQLGRTPSAISHALGRLRREFNDPLFVRVGSALQPTAYAQAMAPRLEAALGELAHLFDAQPQFDPADSSREFSVACADYHELVLWPALLPVLEQRAPRLSVTGRSLGDKTEQAILEQEVDMGITVSPRPLSGLRQRVLFRERFVVAMREEHPLAGKRLTLARYAGAEHILVAPRGTPGSRVDQALSAHRLTRHVRLRTGHFLVAPIAAATSDLLVTLPRRVALALAPHYRLHLERPPVDLPEFSVALLWPAAADRDPAHAWLRAQLVAAAGETRATRPTRRPKKKSGQT